LSAVAGSTRVARQHHILGQELPDDAAASGPKRRAHAQLARTPRAAGELVSRKIINRSGSA